MTRPALAIQDLHRRLGQVAALDGVSLSVGEGEIVCLVGHSGCGKSTLLRVIAGVETLDSGSVSIGDRVVADATTFVEPEHRNIGFMFQDYALFPHLTARHNIAFGLARLDRSTRAQRVHSIIERLGIGALADRAPHQLSGGEQQRVALARALAPQPSVLLMDEPFSNLDRSLRDAVRGETLRLIRSLGTTAIIVTHDPEEALSTGDTVALMDRGRIVETASGEAIFQRPQSAFAARFFSRTNQIPARRIGDRLETPLGVLPAQANCPDRPILLLRPQALVLGKTGVAAKVVHRAFLGEVEELTLEAEGMSTHLTLRSAEMSGVVPGEIVRLGIKPDQALIFAAD